MNILHDSAVIWVGSAVSREKFPPLPDLLRLLFEKLHEMQDLSDASCPYRDASQEVINLTTVTDIDVTEAPANWTGAKLEEVIAQLLPRYADVLGTTLLLTAGSIPLWQFLRLEDVYSDNSIEPDAEHFLLALLIAEGAISEIITTNWDPLVERAYAMLNCEPPLEVVARSAELDRPGHGALVFKIHGCAECVKGDAAQYGPHMIASRADITRWTVNPFFEPFRDQVRTMLRNKPSIFIGISGQDFNLQAECARVTIGGIVYPINPVRIVFTVEEIGAPQRAILEALYDPNYAANALQINSNAALPLFGKPLLGSLYVMLILEKLQCILNVGQAQFPTDELRTLAREALNDLETFLITRYDGIAEPLERWRLLAREVPGFIARFLYIYRDQRMPPSLYAYQPIDPENSSLMALDPNLAAANLHWVILGLALLKEGEDLGKWTLAAGLEAHGADGQLEASLGVSQIAIFIVDDPRSSEQKLEANGALTVGSGRRILIVYPNGHPPQPIRRSPSRALGRARVSTAISELWFEDVVLNTLTPSDIIDIIRSAIIAASPI